MDAQAIATPQDPLALEQLIAKVNEKDVEIRQLHENIEFTDKAFSETKSSLVTEINNSKHLHKLLEIEKQLRIKLQEECCTIKIQLAEEKTRLERNKSLLALTNADNMETNSDDERNDVHNNKEENSSVNNPVVMSAGKPPCIFELTGSCQRKGRCTFEHEISPTLYYS